MKKVVAFLVLVSIMVSNIVFQGYFVSAENVVETMAEVGENTNNYNKLHFYFGDESYSTIDDLTELNQALQDVRESSSLARSTETTYVTLQYKSEYFRTQTYLNFKEERKTLTTQSQIESFRNRLKAYSDEYHADLLEQFDVSDINEYFQIIEFKKTKYSPFVVCEVEPSTISIDGLSSLIELDNIEHISISPECEFENDASWADILDCINATEIVSNSSYTGDGIKIGVFEYGYRYHSSNENFLDKNIINNAQMLQDLDYHATMVTSIVTLIAPEAEIYFDNFKEQDEVSLEWFIDNNCDIVNCSFGQKTSSYRYDIDGLYDYQIAGHFLTVVKSSGNVDGGTTNITSPGYAHNVIVVGGVSKGSYGWSYHYNARYSLNALEAKPLVSAPYYVNVPNVGTDGGTSYAAPQVAAGCGLIMEANPSYRLFPEKIMSVLAASAKKTYNYSATVNHFDDKVGAGVFDLEAALSATLLYETTNYYEPPIKRNVEIASLNISGFAEEILQVSLAWNVQVDSYEDDYYTNCSYLTDYNLKVYDPYGYLLYETTLIANNVEMVRVTLPGSATYRVVIYQEGEIHEDNSGDYLCLSYTKYN